MRKRYLYLSIGLAFLPVFIAGLYVITVSIQARFRYDQTYFTAYYQQLYNSPGTVATALEQVLHTHDPSLFSELTGLRGKIHPPEPRPNVYLMILLKIDDAGYFQYLYFDVKTYERIVYNVKQVNGRWVVVPRDAYYYLDSGKWLIVLIPSVTIWWSLLIVIGVAIFIFRIAARARARLFREANG